MHLWVISEVKRVFEELFSLSSCKFILYLFIIFGCLFFWIISFHVVAYIIFGCLFFWIISFHVVAYIIFGCLLGYLLGNSVEFLLEEGSKVIAAQSKVLRLVDVFFHDAKASRSLWLFKPLVRHHVVLPCTVAARAAFLHSFIFGRISCILWLSTQISS